VERVNRGGNVTRGEIVENLVGNEREKEYILFKRKVRMLTAIIIRLAYKLRKGKRV